MKISIENHETIQFDIEGIVEDRLASIIAPYFDKMDEGQDKLRVEIVELLNKLQFNMELMLE